MPWELMEYDSNSYYLSKRRYLNVRPKTKMSSFTTGKMCFIVNNVAKECKL